jgi:hypothetical protein
MKFGAAAGVTVAPIFSASRSTLAWAQGIATPSPLKFTKYYAGRSGRKIIRDRRFKNLLPSILPKVLLPYWLSTDLFKTLPTFFSLAEPVVVDHHRWVSVQTAVAHNGTTRGLLWIDTAPAEKIGPLAPTVIWANLLTNGPDSQLYLYSDRQLATLSPLQIPNNFKKHLGRFLSLEPRRYQGALTQINCQAIDMTTGICFPEQLAMSYYFYRPA